MAAKPREFAQDLCRSVVGSRLPALDGGFGDVLATSTKGGDSFSLKRGDQKRQELLAASRAGEVVELTIEFRAFAQLEGVSNANFLSFKKGILRKLARSFVGIPLMRDHSQDSLGARAGTVTASRAVKVDGGTAFDMIADVTAPWAVEAVLQGNLDRFSIAWDHPGMHTILCSEDGTPIFSECFHIPGDVLVRDDGTIDRVDFVFTEAWAKEVSGVSVPAAAGTGIDAIRSALSATAPAEPSRKAHSMKKLALALGLSEDADEATILAALSARDRVAEANAKQLGAIVEAQQSAQAELATVQAQLAESMVRETAGKIDKLFADNASKIPVTRDAAGAKIVSPLETSLRTLAAKDLPSATAILAGMQPVAPLAGAAQQTQTLPAGAVEAATPVVPPVVLTPLVQTQVQSQCGQLGISPEDYAKFNPINGTAVTKPKWN